MQYKQAVWNQFENELAKSIKKESPLYKQIVVTTQMLTDGERAGNKMSQVVAESQRLQVDQENAMGVSQRLLNLIETQNERFIQKQSQSKR